MSGSGSDSGSEVRSRAVLPLVAGAAILYVVLATVVANRLLANLGPRPSRGLVQEIILLLLWAAVTPFIFWSAARFPVAGRRWLGPLAIHLGFATLFILLANLLVPPLAELALGRPVDIGALTRTGFLLFLGFYPVAIVVYAFILGIAHYLRLAAARRSDEIRAERLRADLAEAELRSLRLQLQPHFLFNTLNAVGALILTGKHREAFDAVGQLGELLRGILATEKQPEVPLRDELDLTEAYLSIESARLGDRLHATWDIAPETERAELPPLMLQPLVENAIRHGIARSASGGEIVVRSARSGDRLAIEISDNGPGPDRSAGGSGIGLENTRRRLAHLYGAAQRLELVRQGAWTHARIELPFKTRGPEQVTS
jgi:hypothetical protein